LLSRESDTILRHDCRVAETRHKTAVVPFTIHPIGGGAMRVPAVDYIHITPTGNRVFVDFDHRSIDWMRPLMISRLTVDQETAEA
jgi:hypothetical protein